MEYIKENLSTIIIFSILIAYILYQRLPSFIHNLKMEDSSIQENLIFNTLDNKTIYLNDLENKTIVINFWATWCLPCKLEMPILESTYQDLKDHGLEILGITSEDKNIVIRYLEDKNIHYPIILDPDHKLTNYFNIQGYPTIIIIKNNKIISVNTGFNPLLKWKIRWYTKKSLF